MPLNPNTFKELLAPYFDSEASSFVAFPQDIPDMADKWSAAAGGYVASIFPVSTTVSVAQEAFKSRMLGIENTGRVTIQLAFTDMAVQIALGMTAAGYTGTPPVTPLNLEPAWLIGELGGSAADVLDMAITLIDVWIKTGTAILIAPPNTPVLWL